MVLKSKIGCSSFVDLLVFLFGFIVVLNYDYEEQLSPIELLFLIQLILVWFILRIFGRNTIIRYAKLMIFLCGALEALLGLAQLCKVIPSNHISFCVTGTFANPGPYGGFLALSFPVTLYYWLVLKQSTRVNKCFFVFISLILVAVFPITLSRTAWIAAIFGCVFVLVALRGKQLRNSLFKFKKIVGVRNLALLLMFFIASTVYYGYHLKKNSADGRLLTWSITLRAIRSNVKTGVGLGGFPAAFSKAQIDYFENLETSNRDRYIASNMDYAFNGYLKIFLEQGIFGGGLFLVLTFMIIYCGVNHGRIAESASFLSLSIFAIASYPFSLWEFLIVWVILGVSCLSLEKESQRTNDDSSMAYFKLYKNLGKSVVLLLIAGIFIFCVERQHKYWEAYTEWKSLALFYEEKCYEEIIEDYECLYSTLSSNSEFVFQYAIILNGLKRYKMANRVLLRGINISCDSMFYNVRGRNFHEMREYDKAEQCLFQSIHLVPNKIYPYYLLTKLYADSQMHDESHLLYAANIVLNKKPKVYSTAISQMRKEVNNILTNINKP